MPFLDAGPPPRGALSSALGSQVLSPKADPPLTPDP